MPAARSHHLTLQRRYAGLTWLRQWVARQRMAMRTLDDLRVKATVGETYLRVLTAGGTPEDAYAEAARDHSARTEAATLHQLYLTACT